MGGQGCERRKLIRWIGKGEGSNFVASVCEYDQRRAEAKRTNRMVEALELFRSVCNKRACGNTSSMLAVNKRDVFAEKILYSDIQAQRPFEDYPGPPREFNSGVLYFIQKFKECLINDDFNDNFIHVTCATDTNNSKFSRDYSLPLLLTCALTHILLRRTVEFVLDSTRTIIMTDNLRRSGFLGSG